MTGTNIQKTVLITGCSPGGIGHALALEYHSQGLKVIATARNKEVLSDLEERGLSTVQLDVTSPQSISTALSTVRDITNGRLDILVNNAGRVCTMPGVEADLDEARLAFETNFFGVIAVTQAFIPLLIEARGLILNNSSVASILPLPFASVYNASKAALNSYSNTLRLELIPFDVKVVVAMTGAVQSELARNVKSINDNSLYIDIKEDIDQRYKFAQEKFMPANVYAKTVVKATLEGSKAPKSIWEGRDSWIAWLVYYVLGAWVFDLALTRMFHFSKLTRIIREKRKSQ